MEKKELSEVVHLAKANNEEAITELLKRFEPLIASMNHHYFFHEMDQEDFAQEARVMMLRALDKYNYRQIQYLYKLFIMSILYGKK